MLSIMPSVASIAIRFIPSSMQAGPYSASQLSDRHNHPSCLTHPPRTLSFVATFFTTNSATVVLRPYASASRRSRNYYNMAAVKLIHPRRIKAHTSKFRVKLAYHLQVTALGPRHISSNTKATKTKTRFIHPRSASTPVSSCHSSDSWVSGKGFARDAFCPSSSSSLSSSSLPSSSSSPIIVATTDPFSLKPLRLDRIHHNLKQSAIQNNEVPIIQSDYTLESTNHLTNRKKHHINPPLKNRGKQRKSSSSSIAHPSSFKRGKTITTLIQSTPTILSKFPVFYFQSQNSKISKTKRNYTDTDSHFDIEIAFAKAKEIEKTGNRLWARKLYTQLLEKSPTHGKSWIRLFKLVRCHSHINTNTKKKGHPAIRFQTTSTATAAQTDHNSFIVPPGSLELRLLFKEAWQKCPKNAILVQYAADYEKSLGRYQDARRLYEKAIQIDPTLISAYHAWGTMEFKNCAQIDAARSIFRRGLVQNDQESKLWVALGVLEDNQGNSELAKELLEKATTLDPYSPFPYQSLAVKEYKLGNVSAARNYLQRALLCDSTHSLSWFTYARIEEVEGNRDMARKCYVKAVVSLKENASIQIWQGWARMEEQAGNVKFARTIYQKAIRYYPNDSLLYLSYAKLVNVQGESEEARKILYQGLTIDPYNCFLWRDAAVLEMDQFRYDKARDICQEAVNRVAKEDRAYIFHAWAHLEWKLANHQESRNLMQKAVASNPTLGWLWLSYGRLEIELGNEQLARHCFCRGINVDPKYGPIWRFWGELERSHGNEKRAQFCFQKATELGAMKELFGNADPNPLARSWGR